jgi:Uma2 family endonuclease
VELVNGRLEVLAMPTWLHQLIVKYLARELDKWVTTNADGTVLFAPIPVRLFQGTIREPDVLYFRPENTPADGKYPDAVDLVMEVVSESPSDRKRDLEDKRADYAQAGVTEYWIVDPQERRILVLALDGTTYREIGVFTSGVVSSVLLPGFEINADSVFDLVKQ